MDEDIKVRVGADLTGFNSAMRNAGRTAKKFSSNITKYAKRAGFAFAGITVAAAVLGAKFDKEMRFVRSITQATGDEFKAMTDLAMEMGRTTEFTAKQAAEGLRFLGMAGLSAKESMEALPQMLDLATAGEMDLARAADIATNILAQFSLEVSELTRVSDVLAAVQSSANTNIEQAAEAFIYGGTMAKQMGMSVEELAGFVGLLANRGIKASMAGTTLRQSMIKLLNPTREAKEIMEKYNISLTDSEGNMRNFTDVILDMIDAQVDVKDSAVLLGARASQLASIFDMTTDEVIEYINELYNAQGRTEELAESIRKSFWGAWKEVVSKSQDLLLRFFRTFEETGLASLKLVGKGFDKLGKAIEDNAKGIENAFFDSFAAVTIMGEALYRSITGLISLIAVYISKAYEGYALLLKTGILAEKIRDPIGTMLGLNKVKEMEERVEELYKKSKKWGELGYEYWKKQNAAAGSAVETVEKLRQELEKYKEEVKETKELEKIGLGLLEANIIGMELSKKFVRTKGGPLPPPEPDSEEKAREQEELNRLAIEKANALDESYRTREELYAAYEKRMYEERRKREEQYLEESRRIALREANALDESYRTREELYAAYEKKMMSEQIEVRKNAYKVIMGNFATFLQQMGEKNEVAFRAFQAVSIAETIIDTIKAAQSAFAWGMKFGGPFAPAVATAAAASAVAAGMARVAQIGAMTPSSRAESAAMGEGGMPTAQIITPEGGLEGRTTEEPRGQVIINIEGDFIGDEAYIEKLVEKITGAVEDKDIRLIATNTKYSEALLG